MDKKRFNKILFLVLPTGDSRYNQPNNPPASLGYLSQYLLAKDLDYDVLDMTLGYSYGDLKKTVRRKKPGLIGASLFTFQYQRSYDYLNRIKKDFPDIMTIVGGPHASILKEEILNEAPGIDFSVTGEGEEALAELMLGKELEEIKGLSFRKDGKPCFNGPGLFTRELDRIPFPRFEKFEVSRYREKRIPLISSRGCPYSCIFCTTPRICGKQVRFRSPENLLAEVEYWTQRGIRTFPIMDDNFIIWKARVMEFCSLIKEKGLKDINFFCPSGVRADCVSKDLFLAMKEAGFTELSFGVEVGNDKMLKLIKKNETMEQIEKAIQLSVKTGFHTTLFFIIGFPGQTFRDFMDSVDLALRYPVFAAKFFNLTPYPGTELFENIKKEGLFLIPPEQYLNSATHSRPVPVFRTKEMTLKERRRAFRTGARTEIKVIRNYLLNRYADRPALKHLIRMAPLKILLHLYWNNPLFRKLVAQLRYRL